MNKKIVAKQQSIINYYLREYFVQGTKVTTLKNPIIPVERNSSLEHEIMKCSIATALLYDNHSLIINGKFKNGTIPDIVVIGISEPIIYEICKTETEQRLTEKTKKYPFKIKCIKCYEPRKDNTVPKRTFKSRI